VLRGSLLLAAGLASLIAATPAAAKAPVTGEVCGQSGCQVIQDPGSLYQSLRFEGAFSLVDAPRPRPFYRFVFESDEGFRWDVVWVPSARLVRADDRKATPAIYGPAHGAAYWRTLPGPAVAALRAAARGVEPYPAQARWRVRAAESNGTSGTTEGAVALAIAVVLLAGFVIARARRNRAPSALRRLRS
jgi:hypothetical protein